MAEPETARHGFAARDPLALAKKVLLVAAGSLCVGLGVLGILLPVLPTTPFLLLAAWCYARSSQRFYEWLVTNRWFGEYIRNYREGRGMRRQHKLAVLALLWLTIGNTVAFAVSALWLRLLLLAIATGVTIHICRIKTYCGERPRCCRSPQ